VRGYYGWVSAWYSVIMFTFGEAVDRIFRVIGGRVDVLQFENYEEARYFVANYLKGTNFRLHFV
jgi:hypothetical protein